MPPTIYITDSDPSEPSGKEVRGNNSPMRFIHPASPKQNPACREPPLPLSGESADMYDHRIDADYGRQVAAKLKQLQKW